MPYRNSYFGAVAYNGRIYVIGGWDSWDCNDCVLEYDPVNDSWTEIGKLPSPRSHVGAVVINDKILVIGGRDEHIEYFTTVLEFTPPIGDSLVEAPANLTATATDGAVNLKWDPVANASGYVVKRATTSGGPYTSITTTSSISFTDSEVANGTTYYYVVSAIVNGIESENSNEASATPQALNQVKLVLEVKEEKQLSVSDDLLDNTDMDWISSNPEVASVDMYGKVKALKPGDTVITCISKDLSYVDFISVLVVDLEKQLAVDLYVGETCKLTVDNLRRNDVTWTSNNPAIATVSSNGKVTAMGEGLTFITATDKDGNEIGRIYIRVRVRY